MKRRDKVLVCVLTVLLTIVLLLQLLSIGLKIVEFVNANEVLSEELRKTSEEITIQNEKIAALQDMIRQVSENISISIQQEIDTLVSQYHLVKSFCNISSFNWRRVTYINMTDPEVECPSGLSETSNSTTGQRACGRSVDGEGATLAAPRGCSSVRIPVNTTYSHVCGYARGYQYRSMDAFWQSPIRTIDDAYVDGLSITHGNPRKYLWTLAVGTYELNTHLEARCPLDLDTYDIRRIPEFVRNN